MVVKEISFRAKGGFFESTGSNCRLLTRRNTPSGDGIKSDGFVRNEEKTMVGEDMHHGGLPTPALPHRHPPLRRKFMPAKPPLRRRGLTYGLCAK